MKPDNAPTDETTGVRASAGAALKAGIEAGRRKDWHEALHYLLPLLRSPPAGLRLPGLAYSCAGHALARTERRLDEGLALCRRACDEEFFQAENWLHLAWVQLLRRDKPACIQAVKRGLDIAPGHAGLRELHARVGVRRPPVLSFLRRDHPLNVWLGRQRAVRAAARRGD